MNQRDPLTEYRDRLVAITNEHSLCLWCHCYQTFTNWVVMIGSQSWESNTFAELERKLINRFAKPE